MPDATTESLSPFACDMTAIEPLKREEHIATIEAVFKAAQSIREIPDGYTFQLPNDTAILVKAGEFITYERLCCPFFGFSLEIEPEGGAVWLSLTGREASNHSSKLR